MKFTKRFKLVIITTVTILIFVSLMNISLTGISSEKKEKEENNQSRGGWFMQILSLGGRYFNDMVFKDSLTGFAAIDNLGANTLGYIMKTTNGGENWFINYQTLNELSKIQFADSLIGYASGSNKSGTGYICKTTDGGNNWFTINHPGAAEYSGLCVLNKDTLFISDWDELVGGVFRSTNGGLSWLLLSHSNAINIYFLNSKTGFASDRYYNSLYKTPDGGYNWYQIPISGTYDGFWEMKFLDTLTGYKTYNIWFYKTTDGGENWFQINLPNFGQNIVNGIHGICLLNKDTIWGVGGFIKYGPLNNIYRFIIYKSTNAGLSWGYQLPDTHNVTGAKYSFINFFNNNIGWAYTSNGKGVHTISGGSDTTFYTSVNTPPSTITVSDFQLEQNYPNPFNSTTVISYYIAHKSDVEITIYDVSGKKIKEIINKKHTSGKYEISLNMDNYSSGIYFYALSADGVIIKTNKLILLK